MKIFTILGGDHRSVATAQQLSALGFTVRCHAIRLPDAASKHIITTQTLEEALEKADYILLPLPCSTGDGFLNCPLSEEKINLLELAEILQPDQLVFAGKNDKVFSTALENRGITHFDYAEREEFSVLNAIPTAEGALEITLRELPCTINGSSVLITGFGRIAKVLAHILHGMGAEVTVAARKHSDLAWMKAYGYQTIHISTLKEDISRFGVIYNTVPHLIFNRELLSLVKKDCLLVDLASRPGGFDFESAEHLGLTCIWALSLPGKAAPQTAGRIIGDTVLNIINEQEVNA